MMNFKSVSVVLVALVVSTFGVCEAEAGFRGRQANQRARIQQGVASGELTAREARRLRMGERQDSRLLSRIQADGQVTWQEKMRLGRDQARDSRQIWRQKHDGQSR